MSVLVGHASIDENGKASGGAAGDQTEKEVCTRTWYPKPWDYMALHPDAAVREAHASAVEAACANNKVGYDQKQRNTLNTYAEKVGYDLSKITTACECDCSSLQNVCAIASGVVTADSYGSNGWTTSSMLSALIKAGYVIIAKSASITGYSDLTATQKKSVVIGASYLTTSTYCVRGAIYVKVGSHTACGLTNGSKYETTLKKAGISVTTTSTSTTTSATTTTTTTTTASSSSSSSKLKCTSTIKSVQTWLNKYYSTGLTVDNVYGSNTRKALIKAWQKEVGGLTVDGIFGTKSKTKSASVILKSGSTGIIVTIWQAFLVCKGYTSVSISGSYSTTTVTYTKKFQKANSLTQDGQVGQKTWTKAFA